MRSIAGSRRRCTTGCRACCDALKKHGVKTAVVSNKPDAAVKKLSCGVFRRSDGLRYWSEATACAASHIPTWSRRHCACWALGKTRDGAVFVGDSEVDVQTGLNAGLPVIAVSWGFRPREVVIAAGAEQIADNASELKQYILE